MRPSRNAARLHAVAGSSFNALEPSPHGKLLLFTVGRQATAPLRFYRAKWVQVHDAEERQMLAKIRRLPRQERAEHEEYLDSLLDRVEDRRLAREAFEMSKRSLARAWGIDDEADPDKGT